MSVEEQAEEREPKLLIIQSGQTWSHEKVNQLPIKPVCPDDCNCNCVVLTNRKLGVTPIFPKKKNPYPLLICIGSSYQNLFYYFAASSSSSSSLSSPKPDNWFANVNSQLNRDQRGDWGGVGKLASLWPCREGKVGHLNDKESTGWKDTACLIELVLMLMGGVNSAKGNSPVFIMSLQGLWTDSWAEASSAFFLLVFYKMRGENSPDVPAEQSFLHRKAVWLSVWPSEQGRSVFTVDSEN